MSNRDPRTNPQKGDVPVLEMAEIAMLALAVVLLIRAASDDDSWIAKLIDRGLKWIKARDAEVVTGEVSNED